MTYRAWMAARQLLVEERFGSVIRSVPKAEDAAFASAANQAPRG